MQAALGAVYTWRKPLLHTATERAWHLGLCDQCNVQHRNLSLGFAVFFGSKNVGMIYGLMINAWGFGGVLGPQLIS